MAYSNYTDLAGGTALGGAEACEACASLEVDVTFDACNAEVGKDADEVIFGFLKCNAVFTLDGTDPLTSNAPNPTSTVPFTDAVTDGDLVLVPTHNFDKPEAEDITLQLSGYRPEDVVKKRQNFTYDDPRWLSTAEVHKLYNQIAAWSDKGILQCLYVTKHDQCFIYRFPTKFTQNHTQAQGLESVEMHKVKLSCIINGNRGVVPFTVSGLYNALKAVAM